MTKDPKFQLCRQDFLLEALSIHQPPNIVPPKEHAAGTAAVLEFNIEIDIFHMVTYERYKRT